MGIDTASSSPDPGRRLREHRAKLIGYLGKMLPWEPAYLASFAQVLWIDEQLALLDAAGHR
jgi:hypothetical protein